MDDNFVNLGEYKAGCAQRLFLKKKKKKEKKKVISDLVWIVVWISDCKYVLLLV